MRECMNSRYIFFLLSFLLLQKRQSKKEPFTKVFFRLFFRTPKNRFQSAKFLPAAGGFSKPACLPGRASKILYALFNIHFRKSFDLNNDFSLGEYFKKPLAFGRYKYSTKEIQSLYLYRPILFFVLHPDNFSRAGGSSRRVKRLGLRWLKIIKEMHRKIKSALIFSFFCIKAKGQRKIHALSLNHYIIVALYHLIASLTESLQEQIKNQ